MSGLTAVLGETLTGKDGPVQVSSLAKAGHIVGLYFSAHWCVPCRQFTPQLVQWYKDVRDGDVGTKLEIVYISSDENQEEFDEYYGEMPWTALPYDPIVAAEGKLYDKFKLYGIPALVFLEADTGKVLNKHGRSAVRRDNKGENFPWLPKTLSEILTGPVLSKSGYVDLKDVMKDKFLGIYFADHSWEPCQEFLPKLIESYKKLKKAGKRFEIILASSNGDEKSFDESFKDMPWLAFPFEDGRIIELDEHFDVKGIPTLAIVDENLQPVTDEISRVSHVVESDPEGKKFPWIPSPLLKLSEIYGGQNLVFFTDGKEDLIAQAQSMMLEVAEETAAATKASQGTGNELEPIRLIYEDRGEYEEHAQNLRYYLQLESPAPCLAFIDYPKDVGAVFVNPGDLTTDSLREKLSKIRAGTIETYPMLE